MKRCNATSSGVIFTQSIQLSRVKWPLKHANFVSANEHGRDPSTASFADPKSCGRVCRRHDMEHSFLKHNHGGLMVVGKNNRRVLNNSRSIYSFLSHTSVESHFSHQFLSLLR
jgi:hypothetical protein